MSVVLDTNVVVSGLTLPGGQGEKALLAAIDGKVALVISRPLVRELLDVLARKFSRNAEELARVAVFLGEVGELVDPRTRVRVLGDEPDNRVLECAVSGRADAIVTGDRAMLALYEWSGVRILSLRQFLDRIGA